MTAARTSSPAPGPARMVILAVSLAWLLFPFLQWQMEAQDAAPFLIAGELALDGRNADIYADEGEVMAPEFRRRSCEQLGADVDCNEAATPFISLPTALIPGVLLSPLPTEAATAVLRLAASAAMVAALWSLRRRFIRGGGEADVLLAVTAVALTPYAYYVTYVGQNSPVLFLSAVMGLGAVGAATRAKTAEGAQTTAPTLASDIGRAALWSAAIALKAFPAALALLVVALRRWRLLACAIAWSVAALAVSLVIGAPDLVTDFVESTARSSDEAIGKVANQSLHALVNQHVVESDLAGPLITLALFAGVLALWWRRIRFAPADTQWAWAWVALIAVIPQSWWHYVVLTVAAVAVAVADRPTTDTTRWAVAGVAAVTGLLALPVEYGLFIQTVQVVTVFATLVGVAAMTPRPKERAQPSSETEPTTNVPSS